jgi:putative transposase
MQHSARFRVEKMAVALKISRSGYYAGRSRPVSRREEANHVLVTRIKVVHEECRQVYGSPRMTAELKRQGVPCSRNRVARVMKENGIAAKTKRKFKVTTASRHKFPIAPNLLEQSFSAPEPNRVWASDITYIPTREGWLYLATVLDLHSRSVVGWAMSDRLQRDLVMDAFKQAVRRRMPSAGLVFHSDRGVQYACSDFRDLLANSQAVQSMSGKGSCYDNAVSESFFKTLKTELVYFLRFNTRAEAKSAIFDYIEVFYNRQRLHSTLGYLSPAEFEGRGQIRLS